METLVALLLNGYLGLFELLECLICDLNVWIQSDTYFSSNASNQVRSVFCEFLI